LILCDVSVLLQALVRSASHHEICRRAVESLRGRPAQMACSELILAAVVRIATNPKLFRPAAAPADVFAYVDTLRDDPDAVLIAPGQRHWRIYRDLVLRAGIRGPDTTDAYLAALAIEHGCEWWTTDAGFGRFTALRWRNLLESGDG
jgi:toxin-antitoxin system PIN domain toxin